MNIDIKGMNIWSRMGLLSHLEKDDLAELPQNSLKLSNRNFGSAIFKIFFVSSDSRTDEGHFCSSPPSTSDDRMSRTWDFVQDRYGM